MQINVALDGSKRRDLTLFEGDEVTLSVVVYEEDGDTVPLSVTDARFSWPESGGFALGEEFTVSSDSVGRHYYRLVGEIGGVTTTLAHGYIIVEGEHGGWPWPGPYGDYGVWR